MKNISEIYTNSELDKFADKEWRKNIVFLQKYFGLCEEDCEDVFQEAFITLYENIQSGKLLELTSSLSTYFTGICKNKAQEHLKGSKKTVNVDKEMSISLMSGDVDVKKLDTLLALEDDSEVIKEQKEQLVREIVTNLPSPCNELLWGFYRDNLTMKALADMYNYSEGSVKVTKHRCCEKFRNRYNELCKQLF